MRVTENTICTYQDYHELCERFYCEANGGFPRIFKCMMASIYMSCQVSGRQNESND